jgi:glycosyltransferase involved in cell wall biosynthesis
VEDTQAFIRQSTLAKENGQSPTRKGPIRICLLTSAIAGPTPSGGVGTAFRALALHLANSVDASGAKRFTVTVLYAAHPWYGEGTAAQWMEHFGRLNVRFVPLVSAASEDYYGPKLLVRAYRAFQFLLQHEGEFDVLTYADHLGNGYFAAMAKRQGLALQGTYIMAQCHSTLRWADSLNARPPKDHNTLAYYHMEQKSVEWADARVSPSLDYLKWYTSDEARFDLSHGLNFVLPNLLHPMPAPLASKAPRPCMHFVFFGRLEVRKGLLVFLEAVERLIARTPSEAASSLALAPAAVAQLRISFVGPDVSVGGEKGSLLIKRRLEHVLPPGRLTLETGLTTQHALAYIAQGDATAVLPTLGDNSPYVVLEIVAAGLPLITTSAGGGKELVKLTAATAPFVVAPGDARALASAMKLALEQGIPTFEVAFPFDQATEAYLDLMLAFAAQNSRAGAQGQRAPSNRGPGLLGATPINAAGPPRILVGITSHNRPDVLTRAVTSLFGQTYPRSQMGIIIEDDASDHADMPSTLDRLESQLSKAALAMAEVHRNVAHRFVAETRNAILQQAADNNFDWACFMVRVAGVGTCLSSFCSSIAGLPVCLVFSDKSHSFRLRPVPLVISHPCFFHLLPFQHTRTMMMLLCRLC